MSNLWIKTAEYSLQAAHDEDAALMSKIGHGLQTTRLHYQSIKAEPGSQKSYGGACPDDGSCTVSHHVPLEGGYTAVMTQRNGRMNPFVIHECSPGKPWPIKDNEGMFTHPLHGMSIPRSSPEELGAAMQDYAYSPGVTEGIRQHHRECKARPV